VLSWAFFAIFGISLETGTTLSAESLESELGFGGSKEGDSADAKTAVELDSVALVLVTCSIRCA
jgi:hypothetical protein